MTTLEKMPASPESIAACDAINLESATPMELIDEIHGSIKLLGAEVMVYLTSGPAGFEMDASYAGRREELPPVLKAAIEKITPLVMRCEISEWDEDYDADGRIRFCQDGDVWMDVADNVEDWLLERSVDLDMLEEMEFEEEGDLPEVS